MNNCGNEFLIIREFKHFIVMIEGEYGNCAKKDCYLKDEIYRISYDILKDLYFVNSLKEREKEIGVIIGKLKLLDFMIKRSMDKGMLSYKRFLVIGKKLNEVVRMHYGWLKSEKKKLAL